jgi:probable HAF family extracellular repeat protein
LNWVNDINPRGEIVGYYNDHDRVQHGFVYRNGAFKSIDPPGAIATQGLGINPQGDVVGGYVTSDGNTHGFFLACAACSLR